MQISITARQIDLEEDMKSYANEKITKLGKYSSKIENARVVFSLEKFNNITEIVLTGKRLRIAAVEKDEELRSSFNKSIDSIENQLKKFRARTKDRKLKRIFQGIKNLPLVGKSYSTSMESGDAENSPQIIRTESFAKKPMTPEEAALELKVFGKDFIVFKNSDTEEMNVLYCRKDGNYGLIEP